MSENTDRLGPTAGPCKHERWRDTHHAGRLCDDCDEELTIPPLTEAEVAASKAEHEELLARWRRFDAQQKAQREAIETWNAQPLHMRLRILSTMHSLVAGESEIIDAAPKPNIAEYEAAHWAAVAVLRCVVKP